MKIDVEMPDIAAWAHQEADDAQIQFMDFHSYQVMAMRTRSDEAELGFAALVNAAMGSAGEAGEVVDIIKKVLFHGHPLTKELAEKIVKELGDQLWYIALACYALQIEMDDVARINIEKLRRRYPLGFQTQRSLHRAADG